MDFAVSTYLLLYLSLFLLPYRVIACDKFSNDGLMLKQLELSQPNAELRLLEVFYHKIYKVLTGFS